MPARARGVARSGACQRTTTSTSRTHPAMARPSQPHPRCSGCRCRSRRPRRTTGASQWARRVASSARSPVHRIIYGGLGEVIIIRGSTPGSGIERLSLSQSIPPLLPFQPWTPSPPPLSTVDPLSFSPFNRGPPLILPFQPWTSSPPPLLTTPSPHFPSYPRAFLSRSWTGLV